MIDGGKTKADPEAYKIVDGTLYVFYKGIFGDTLKSWNQKAQETPESGLISAADTSWASIVK